MSSGRTEMADKGRTLRFRSSRACVDSATNAWIFHWARVSGIKDGRKGTYAFQTLQADRERFPCRLLREGLDLGLLLWWDGHEGTKVVVLAHRVLAWMPAVASQYLVNDEAHTGNGLD